MEKVEQVKLRSANDIRKLLEKIINDVLSGRMNSRDAMRVGDLCKIQLRAIKQAENGIGPFDEEEWFDK